MVNPNAPEDMKKDFLRCSHINFHIIACLRAKKALDDSQVSQLSGESSLFKRSQMVFDWMENNQSFRDVVCRVMNENEQEHVSNLLQGIQNGPYIPLSPVRYNRLESITPKLMLTIRNDEELIAKLREKSAISEIDRQDITHKSEEYKRNWNLIEAIRRRSDYAFNCFEQALRETLQDHAANYLHEGQMIAVHAKTTQPEKDDVLSVLLNKVIIEETKDVESSEEKILTTINGYNIHPVATKPGQSIVFFLYCKTVDNVITFTELFISGDLQSMIEVIMNSLLLKIGSKTTEQLKARLKLDDTEILDVERFSGIEDWMPVELKEATITSLICTETQTEHQQSDEDTDAIRKKYWEEERKLFHHKFQSLLVEEEELLKRFLPETAPSEQERNWTQKRNTLSQEFDKLLEAQNYIFKSLFTMPNMSGAFSTPAFNKIDLYLHNVRYLKSDLERTGGDIFCKLENLKAEGKNLEETKDKQQNRETSSLVMYHRLRTQHRQRELLLLKYLDKEEILEQYPRRTEPKMSSPWKFRSYGYERLNSDLTSAQLFFLRNTCQRLTELRDLDSQLLSVLFERDVLNNREYMYISSFSNWLERNEALLFIVARKMSEDFYEFQDVLTAALRSDVDTKTKTQLTLHQKIFSTSSVYGRDAVQSHKKDFISGLSNQDLETSIIWMNAEDKLKNSIRGLTILDRELFVVNEESSEVKVYDRIKCQIWHSRQWQLEELIRPQDIGSCSRNKCLYILNCKVTGQATEIMRVDPNGKLIKTWSTGIDIGYVLSVTNESNVILTVCNETKLNEYSPDGQLIREIYLSSEAGFNHLYHAIKMSNGDYVVSHGDAGDQMPRVCIVDADGKLKKSFGGTWAGLNKQLDGPVYLAFDENGFVMVVDRWNSRVLQLDPDLQFQREIISKEKHGLREPTRVLVDKSNGQLLVADNSCGSQRIMIFDLNKIILMEGPII